MSLEQRINLKTFVRFGKTPTEALNLFNQVYEDNVMLRTCVFK